MSTNENVSGEGIDRRAAIKKGLAAGAAAGVIWSAPKIEGLTLRPSYASASTVAGNAEVTISYNGANFGGTAVFDCCDYTGSATMTRYAAGGGNIPTNIYDLTTTANGNINRTGFATVPPGLLNTGFNPLAGADEAGTFNIGADNVGMFNVVLDYSCPVVSAAGFGALGAGGGTGTDADRAAYLANEGPLP